MQNSANYQLLDTSSRVLALSSQDAGGIRVWGITYVPTLAPDQAACFNTPMMSNPPPRIQDIPHNTTLIAVAPVVSLECTMLLMNQAIADKARLLVLANDTLITNGVPFTGTFAPISIVGISTANGQNVLQHMSQYSTNETVLVPDTAVDTAVKRVGLQIQSDLSSTLPKLWVFVLAVLAGVLAIIIGVSLLLNFMLYLRRRNLRRRILNGEVNLELLGVKRLTVPDEILEKIPIRIYTHGEQHFANEQGGEPEGPKNKLWKAKLSKPGEDGNKDIEMGPIQNTSGYFQTDCPICLEDFENNVTQVRELPCKHIYHLDCIDPFLKTRSSLCPLCKKSTLPPAYFPPSLRLTNATVRREREMRMRANDPSRGDVPPGLLGLLQRPLTRFRTSQVSPNELPVTEVSSEVRRSIAERAPDANTASAARPATPSSSATPAAPAANGTHSDSAAPDTLEVPNSSIAPTTASISEAPGVVRSPAGLEAMALTEEEEAAAQSRQPGWRRVLHSVFPV